MHELHAFDDNILSLNREINEKTNELIEWESGVVFVTEDSVPDREQRLAEEEAIVEGIKKKLAELLFQKAHINKITKELERKISRHRHLRQAAADELDSIISKLAL